MENDSISSPKKTFPFPPINRSVPTPITPECESMPRSSIPEPTVLTPLQILEDKDEHSEVSEMIQENDSSSDEHRVMFIIDDKLA